MHFQSNALFGSDPTTLFDDFLRSGMNREWAANDDRRFLARRMAHFDLEFVGADRRKVCRDLLPDALQSRFAVVEWLTGDDEEVDSAIFPLSSNVD